MRRLVLAAAATAAALLLIGPVQPASADDGPTPTPVENGEVVIDPTFITATPIPVAEVAAATGRPQPTPPSTDTLAHATASSTGLQVLSVLGVAGPFLVLVLARAPSRRRR